MKKKEQRNKEICELYLTGNYSMVEIGKQFNITKQVIFGVLKKGLSSKDRKKIKKLRAKKTYLKRKPKILQ